MSGGDEVRITAAAVLPLTADQNPNKSREEGELSSSDDDEIPTLAAAPPSAEITNIGRYSYTDNFKRLEELPSNGSALSNCQRSTQKNRTPFVPFVIRFSDDDSDSESEESKRSKPSEVIGTKENKKPVASSVPKPQLLQQTTRHVARAMPNRSSLTRTFTPTMINSNNKTSVNGGHGMVDKGSHIKGLSTSNRKLVDQERGGSNIDHRKLQDLRQQIAMREKELKLKSVTQKNKYSGSGSCRTYNVSDSEIDAPSKRRINSADFSRFEVKEPGQKRVKLIQPRQIQQISDAHQHMSPLEPWTPSGDCAINNTDKKSMSNHRQVDTVGSLSSGTQIINEEKGVDITTNGNSYDMDKLVYSSNSSEQTKNTELTQIASPETYEVRIDEKLLEPAVNSKHQEGSISVQKRHLETSDAIINDARLCNFLDTIGIAQDDNMNLDRLFDIEEMHDKELEEAQEHRHKCEVEERNALRAYRKAQKALIEANARCSHIYRKGELFSAHLRSLMVENPRFLQSSTLETGMNSLEHVPDDDVATDTCSKPDDSTSALQKDTGLSASTCEGDETFPLDKSVDSRLGCRESTKVIDDELERRHSLDTSQDSLLLETTLRSQLFARLGTKLSSKNMGPSHNLEPSIEPRAKHSGDDGQAETNIGNMSSSVKEKCRYSASEDGKQTSRSFTFSCPILRSTFTQLKIAKQDSTIGLNNRNQGFNSCDTYHDEGTNNLNSPDFSLVEKVGYYTSNVAIDPFQPLCVFELRGKCNNDECPWQHIKDYSSRTINLESSENFDYQVDLSNSGGKLCMAKQKLRPPAYLVSLDMMKADLHPHGSLVATRIRQCWQKCLSTSLVLSTRLTSYSPMEESLLHASDARVEVHGSRNNQSLYFHKIVPLNLLDQQFTDNDQILEVALLNVLQEANERNGRKEALRVLARALETNPSRVILWVAYLHIYHSANHLVKDDMFSFAVELNQGSYELWLIYINTRMQLEDRLTAYNNGILALCHHGSAADGNASYTSACILDLFLQYLNCFCNSGHTSRAIEKIDELFPSEKNSKSCDLLLSNILQYLTPQDKCIIWFCCIYITVYKKLPYSIVQCFEFYKELNELEWPSAYLTSDVKHRADLCMRKAVDLLPLVLDNEALKSDSAISATHMFAINHVKCIAVLEGIEHSRKLVDNYMKKYPSCLEFVLMSAQMKASEFGDLKFVGFEDALRNWNEEVPGIQCIWNQYANFALQNGGCDFVKQLMERWFHSVWQVRCFKSASELDGETWSLNSSKIDVVFGLINLSLHKSFDNNLVDARLAINEALKAASAEQYKHCVKEHVSFLLSSGDATSEGLLDILRKYLVDPRAISTVQPLSRKFINDIKRPRVRNLVSNIWSDLSPDFSLVNLVLEVFYGPSLLCNLSCKLEDLVDLIEALMEIAPANYRLAISVGKLLNRDLKLADVAFAGVSFWAASLITNSFLQAVPIPPELTWIEAADTLRNLTDARSITETFHKKALTAYPLSIQLWKSFLDFSEVTRKSSVIAAAKERGIILD